MNNIFFDLDQLKNLGMNSIIGKTVRIRYPELCDIGNDCIIDDFTYLSTKLKLNSFCHIGASVTIGGGSQYLCSLGNFSGISSGCRLYCGNVDWESEITSIIPKKFRLSSKSGDIIMEDFTGVGVNSGILPNVKFSEGSTVGALSLVPQGTVLEPWTMYAGIPVKPIKRRNEKSVRRQAEKIIKNKNTNC